MYALFYLSFRLPSLCLSFLVISVPRWLPILFDHRDRSTSFILNIGLRPVYVLAIVARLHIAPF